MPTSGRILRQCGWGDDDPVEENAANDTGLITLAYPGVTVSPAPPDHAASQNKPANTESSKVSAFYLIVFVVDTQDRFSDCQRYLRPWKPGPIGVIIPWRFLHHAIRKQTLQNAPHPRADEQDIRVKPVFHNAVKAISRINPQIEWSFL